MTDTAREAAKRLAAKMRTGALRMSEDKRGVVVELNSAGDLIQALEFVKKDSESPFDMLMTISAVDWLRWKEQTGMPQPEKRYSLTYNLYSMSKKVRLFVQIAIMPADVVPSAVSVYASANWAEREVFDMFGIQFGGHPELRRIYLPEDFSGHPLQKDFPLQGHEPQDFPQE